MSKNDQTKSNVASNVAGTTTTVKENTTMANESATPTAAKQAIEETTLERLTRVYPRVAANCVKYHMPLKEVYSLAETQIVIARSHAWTYKMTRGQSVGNNFSGAKLTTVTTATGSLQSVWSIPIADLEEYLSVKADKEATQRMHQEDPRTYKQSRNAHGPRSLTRADLETLLSEMSDEAAGVLRHALQELAAQQATAPTDEPKNEK